MHKASRYPSINLGSKNEIAKRISSKKLPYKNALALINDVLKNFDSYWYDSKRSEPEKGKYVRSAAKSPQLKGLLELINERILAPYDHTVPEFIFGGLTERNNIQAARLLLGKKRGRILLKLDVRSFFEQIRKERVFHFFHSKCGCGVRAAEILARLCCVPKGPKGSDPTDKIIARGFATSSRLAMWCNLDTFQHLDWKVKEKLRGHDTKVVVYVDDIGITASRVNEDKMKSIKELAIGILENNDLNQPLPVHRDERKTKITSFGKAEHLGIKLGRSRLSLGSRARQRTDRIKFAVKNAKTRQERSDLLIKYRAHQRYKKQVELLNIK